MSYERKKKLIVAKKSAIESFATAALFHRDASIILYDEFGMKPYQYKETEELKTPSTYLIRTKFAPGEVDVKYETKSVMLQIKMDFCAALISYKLGCPKGGVHVEEA